MKQLLLVSVQFAGDLGDAAVVHLLVLMTQSESNVSRSRMPLILATVSSLSLKPLLKNTRSLNLPL